MRTTVEFVKDEIIEHVIYLDDEVEYIIVECSRVGEHTIEVDGECRIVHQNEFDVTLENDETEEEFIAGKFIVVAQPDVELPNWTDITTEYYSSAP